MITTPDWRLGAMDEAGRTLAGKGPIHMVNLLRFRAQADYGDLADLPPCSGREAFYRRYVPAFAKVAHGKPFTIAWVGNAHATVVAPAGETWDDIAIVEYPSFEVLQSIVNSPEYETEAHPHHLAAIEDWRFIATVKLDLPA